MTSEKLLNDLEEIVNRGLEDSAMPHQRGNSIRIKHVIIRKNPKGYLIYDAEENKQVVRVYFKSSAVAIAKNLAQDNDITDEVVVFDQMMLKHYNDAVFYKNAIKMSDDPFKIEIRETRLDVSIRESQRVRSLLDRFIFC